MTPASRLEMLSFRAKPSANPVRPMPATMPMMWTPSVPSAVMRPSTTSEMRAMLARSSPSGPCARVRSTMRSTPKCAARERTRNRISRPSATRNVGIQTMACDRASRRSSSTALALRRVDEVRQADAPHERQLEAGAVGAEVEAEEVQLEAVDRPGGDAEDAGHGELEAAAARGAGDEVAADVVLADRGRRQVDLQLGHRPRDPSGEGVGVRAGPERVGIGVRIVVRRLVDALDEVLDPGAALVRVELDLGAEPRRVGLPAADDERAVGPAQAPADDLVDGPRRRVRGLHRHPRMDAEEALHPH